MSQELPNNNKTEEVDLSFIFKTFERVIKKIGDLIYFIFQLLLLILEKIFIFILFLINLVRKNFIIVLLTGIIGFSIFYVLEKSRPTVYVSKMLIKQNFETGKVLYRNITTYNGLAAANDSIALAKVLDIPVSVASKLKQFGIRHSANKIVLLEEYFEFLKLTDSTFRMSYDEFVFQKNLEEYPYQSITVVASDPYVYDGLSNSIMESILKNKYLEDLKEKDLETINRKKSLLNQLVVETDTFQSNYFRLLENYYGLNESKSSKLNNSTINLNLENKKETINTKEYDLFNTSKELKLEINEIEDVLKQKEDIFVIQESFSAPSTFDEEGTDTPFNVAVIFVLLIILILLIKELDLIDKLNKFGTKEKLFEKIREK